MCYLASPSKAIDTVLSQRAIDTEFNHLSLARSTPVTSVATGDRHLIVASVLPTLFARQRSTLNLNGISSWSKWCYLASPSKAIGTVLSQRAIDTASRELMRDRHSIDLQQAIDTIPSEAWQLANADRH